MKYIIDMIDDLHASIDNAQGYALVAMLVKEADDGTLQNAGEKIITSLSVDHEARELHLGFADEDASTTNLLECVNALEMAAMMYELMVKISDAHPLMPVIGFGENHETKEYLFFVTA
ncbi:MAG: hypothetical protein WBF77_09790 [Sulfurimonadaceae bacterium]